MSNSDRWVPFYVVAILVVAGVLAIAGYDAAVQPEMHPSPSSRVPIQDLAGTWAGTWHDTVFHVERPMSWQILVDDTFFIANGTIDLSNFGMGDNAGSAVGTISGRTAGDTLQFTFEAPGVGSGGGVIAGTAGGGTGNVTPPLNFGGFSFLGTVSDTVMRGTFMYFTPGSGAGTVRMTKDTPVDASSWGKLKARYRDDG